MSKTLTTIAAATLMATSGMAAAEVTFSGNVALTSDYVFRGYSQADEDPAIQGGFDLEHSSGFYAGVWGSNVDFNDGDEAHIEVDLYAGFSGEFSNKLGYDVGVIHYDYPGADGDLEYDFNEIYGSLSYDFGPAAATVGLAYSSDFFGNTLDDGTYVYVGVDVPLPNDFTLGLHYGTTDVDGESGQDDFEYDDWKLGLGKSYGGFDFALDYIDTDVDNDTLADDRFVFTISKSL